MCKFNNFRSLFPHNKCYKIIKSPFLLFFEIDESQKYTYLCFIKTRQEQIVGKSIQLQQSVLQNVVSMLDDHEAMVKLNRYVNRSHSARIIITHTAVVSAKEGVRCCNSFNHLRQKRTRFNFQERDIEATKRV